MADYNTDMFFKGQGPELETPLEAQNKVMQFKNLANRTEMEGINLQESQNKFSDEKAYRSAMSQNTKVDPISGQVTTDKTGVLKTLASNPNTAHLAPKIGQQFTQQEYQEETQKINKTKELMGFGAQVLGQVTDEPSYQRAKAQAEAVKPGSTSDWLPHFDPDDVKARQYGAIDAVKQLELQLKDRESRIQTGLLGLKIQESKQLDKTLSPGQRSADIAFGKEYQDWNAQGGFVSVENNLKQLEEAASILEKNKGLTGGPSSVLPDSVRKRTSPLAFSVQQQVEKAIQATLRQTLGASFTEKEGLSVLARTFDPALSSEENAKRIRREAAQLRSQAKQKDTASKYFEEHGTLEGFKAPLSSLNKETNLAPMKAEKTPLNFEDFLKSDELNKYRK